MQIAGIVYDFVEPILQPRDSRLRSPDRTRPLDRSRISGDGGASGGGLRERVDVKGREEDAGVQVDMWSL